MGHIAGASCDQTRRFPDVLEDDVPADNPVGCIAAVVEGLERAAPGQPRSALWRGGILSKRAVHAHRGQRHHRFSHRLPPERTRK
jgi:hypothetical protein